MLTKKILKKAAAVVLSAAAAGLFGIAGYYSVRLPENVTAESATSVSFAMYPELSCIGNVSGFDTSKSDRATLSLFGAIPVKSVNVHENEAPTLVVCGEPFGVKLLMEGVMVTGMGKVDCPGEDICPAELAGVEIGGAGMILIAADSQLRDLKILGVDELNIGVGVEQVVAGQLLSVQLSEGVAKGGYIV